jgi:hypothetical protein
MTNDTENTTSKSPSHYVYRVRDRKGQKPIWTQIGAAWPQKDGKGLSVQLHAVPLDGRITLRVPSEE